MFKYREKMKKILLLSVVILLSASCAEESGIAPANETWFYVREYTVRSDQWRLVGGEDELDSYYEYEVSVPDLDRDVFYYGNVDCYMYLDNDYTIQAKLPEVIHRGQYNPTTREDDLWTETYKCDYAIGSILFKVEYSDFYTGNRPGTKKFRVFLVLYDE
jgi:hypothetical protein